jgi:hypothetical protein
MIPFRAWGLKVREWYRFSTKRPNLDDTYTHREYPTKGKKSIWIYDGKHKLHLFYGKIRKEVI